MGACFSFSELWQMFFQWDKQGVKKILLCDFYIGAKLFLKLYLALFKLLKPWQSWSDKTISRLVRRRFNEQTTVFCHNNASRQKKTNLFVCSLGELTVWQSVYGFIWPLEVPNVCWDASFFSMSISCLNSKMVHPNKHLTLLILTEL